jgi:hypothetical protein
MKIDILKATFLAAWVAALILVTGVFGNHKYIVTALALIGIAIAIIKHHTDAGKNSN